MSRHDDTIAALGSASGTAAIAVVRITGPDTQGILREILGKLPRPRVATHADYRDRTGQLLDDVIVTLFVGPRSYTGEDTAEISTHGNPFIVQRVLEDLFARGCRAANPGEFTQRAFLNGRMDLSQAEAVMDIIQARSERALASANAQLRGALGIRIQKLVSDLLQLLAKIEAYIDFPEEDLPPGDRSAAAADLDVILLAINGLLATSRYGAILRDGVKTVIAGLPNAGKSSLLNALVGSERALVSDEPGTTRDFLEERVVVGPHMLRVIDTAGLNPSPAPLERRGIEKALERVDEADLFLLVIDASSSAVPTWPDRLRSRLSRANTLVVANKIDLPTRSAHANILLGLEHVNVSALHLTGLDALRSKIVEKIDALGEAVPSDSAAISARHAQALQASQDALIAAETKLRDEEPVELLASDLRAALSALGEVVGRIDNERMLDALFATFCIGK